MAAVDAGWTVVGVDNFASKVAQISGGVSPVEDVSDAQLKAALSSGSYKATTEISDIANASVIAICVPTPVDDKREPDLGLLRSAAFGIAPFIANETLVISESTSYPGTLRNVIVPTINSAKPTTSPKIYFASAPERVNPGDPVWNQRNTPRLVGAIDSESQSRAIAFYESICDAVVSVSTPEVAEAAKLLENTFRLINIALVLEFNQICSTAGIDVHEVIDAASTKPYGYMPFRPGVGVGGHCIPVDPLYLTWWARQHGGRAELVESADSVSHKMPRYVAQRAIDLVPSSSVNPKVLILGVAYKPGVSDVRESPVSELRDHLLSLGANVAWHDPLVQTWEDSKSVDLDWQCDVAVLAVKQPGMNFQQLTARGVEILDCTNTMKGCAGVTPL